MTDLPEQLASHRPELLRHCYRMLGCFADAEDLVQDVLLNAWRAQDSYAGQAPLRHWLMRIATHACLNELARRRRRKLPQLEHPPAAGGAPIEEREASEWVTPGPDARLFAGPVRALETRESVALAFLALLQRLPPRQRAVLLLKDVVGWSAAEVAAALELSVGSVNSALHRARQTIAEPALDTTLGAPPSREVWQAYCRSWEARDVDALAALMREDIVFTMPPHATWFRGRANVERFVRGPILAERWAPGFRTLSTSANGELGLAFYRRSGSEFAASSPQVVRFVDDRIQEITSFVGGHHLRDFDLPDRLTP